MIQVHRTSSNLPELHHYRDSKVCIVLSHKFGVVRLHRTFSIYIVTGETRYTGCHALVRGGSSTSNLIELSGTRDSKVCSVLSREFMVVRLYRTFSIYIVPGETRCTSSGCLKHIEPYRTFSNHIISEVARCVEFCHMSSGKVCGSTAPNLLYLHRYRGNKECRVLMH